MDNKILEIFIPGPAGRLEAKYYKSKKPTSPIALVLQPHPQYGGTMNNKVVVETFQAFMEGSNDVRVMRGYVYKNGSALNSMQTRLAFNSNLLDAGSPVGFIVSGVLNLSVSDYLEAYVYIYNTAGEKDVDDKIKKILENTQEYKYKLILINN